MKFKQIIGIGIIAFICGIAIGYIYFVNDVSDDAAEGTKLRINVEVLSVTEITKALSDVNEEEAIQLLFVLCSMDNWMEKEKFIFRNIAFALIKENPEKLQAFLESPTFFDAHQSVQKYCLKTSFNMLGGHPDLFPAFYSSIMMKVKDKNQALIFHREMMNGFLSVLSNENPFIAHNFLTQGGLQSIQTIYSEKTATPLDVIEKSDEVYIGRYRREIVCNNIMEFPDGFFTEIRNTSYNHDRMEMIHSLLDAFSSQGSSEAILFAKQYLSEKEMGNLANDFYWQMYTDGTNSSDLLKAKELLGFSNVNPTTIGVFINILFQEDINTCIDFIEENVRGEMKERAIGEIVLKLGDIQDVEQQAALIDGFSKGYVKEITSKQFSERYYLTSPDKAIDWIFKQENKEDLLKNVLTKTIWTNASELIPFTERVLNRIENKGAFVEMLGKEFARFNPEDGVKFSEKLDENLRIEYLESLYKSWAEYDASASEISRKDNSYFQ